MPKKIGPIEFAREQQWRKVWVDEAPKAQRLRKRLVDVGVYPFQEAEPNTYHEAVLRNELLDILAELDYTDLIALHGVARLLAIVPRNPAVFAYGARHNLAVLAAHGIHCGNVSKEVLPIPEGVLNL